MSLDQRDQIRYDFPYTVVEYVLNSTNDETLKGFISDISKSGLCLYTSRHLSVGQEITIKSILPIFTNYCNKASVRWIEKYDDFFYKVGLEFH